jgi:hypothetical protein
MDIRTATAAALCGLGVIGGMLGTAPLALADSDNVAAPAPPPPTEVPHLSSPDNLPPGTSVEDPVGPGQSRGLTYLQELWQAVQTQNVSPKDALLLLTQRPMDANSAPPPGLPVNPVAPPGSPPPAQ